MPLAVIPEERWVFFSERIWLGAREVRRGLVVVVVVLEWMPCWVEERLERFEVLDVSHVGASEGWREGAPE